jgi:[acyl-carrier-protein] S-malonyltransferase
MTKLNPKTTAFVFPGQGSQSVGMGRGLAETFPAARQIFDEADALFGFAFSKLMWEGPVEELNDTINTQPALFVHSLAAYRAFADQQPGFSPAFVAGHSLGELSALTVAGALTFADGLRLLRRRGELMKRAGEIAPGGMAAILGLDIPMLDKLCAEASAGGEIVQVANDNCPGQVVISGAKAAVERAIELAKSAGARRALPLAVSIAAHSPLMTTVQAEFDAAVTAANFQVPGVAVVGNVSAATMISVEDLCADVRAQLTSRVRWTDSIRLMTGKGVTTFVEVGTGSVLLGLIKRIAPEASGLPLGVPADFAAIV